MLTRPDDLSDQAVVGAVADGWGLRSTAAEYLPVGFGSHHWRVDAAGERWFVTVDDLITKRMHRGESHREPLGRLRAALETALTLRHEGLTFVLAPIPTSSNDVVVEIDGRYAIAVYPFVVGATGSWDVQWSSGERLAVLDLIVDVHRATGTATEHAIVDDHTIPSRQQLVIAMEELATPWDSGPFGESTRTRLARYSGDVERALDRHDSLAHAALERTDRMVLTHGEPHPANVISTDRGLMLIDWDTVRVAPPERDVWTIADGEPQMLDSYERATGVALTADALGLYRLGWDLTEISQYVDLFRQPHRATADTATAWAALERHLDPRRWYAA